MSLHLLLPKICVKYPIYIAFFAALLILLTEIQQGIIGGKIFSYKEIEISDSPTYEELNHLTKSNITRAMRKFEQYIPKKLNSTLSNDFKPIIDLTTTRKEYVTKKGNTTKKRAPKPKKVIIVDDQSTNAINFHINPQNFITTLSNCFNDVQCNVIYHHIGKTGGTNVESRLFKVFPFHPKKPKMGSCCSTKLMDKFKMYPSIYCRAKFTAYQVRASQFETVVTECINQRPEKSRIVVLVSIREPASRTLSNIHQLCNKNLNRRDEKLRKACEACDYEAHTESFDKIVQTTNKDYLGIIRTAKLSKLFPSYVKSLMFDTDDIDRMFTMMQMGMTNYTFPLDEKKNPEKHSRCNFGMKSNMFKDLAISQRIYRNISSGQVY